MFSHIFNYQLKCLIRDKQMWFWTLIFPIILATFFNLAFSSISSKTTFDPVNVAVINNQVLEKDESLQDFFNSVSSESNNKIFNIQYTSEEEAIELLKNNDISGYIIAKDKLEPVFKNSGINQTIVKNVIDSYYQTVSVIGNIVAHNPEAIKKGVLDLLNEENEYFDDVSNKNVDVNVSYFYSLIAMVCLYGAIFSIFTVSSAEANLSKNGARTSVAPTHKLKVLAASLLTCLIIHYLEVLLLIAYINFILGINLGNQVIPILILSFFGCVAGSTMGMVMAYSNKKSEDFKMAIAMTIIMLLSFLSGLMFVNMKYIIAENVPFLTYINPATMVTDALYSLYYYTTYDRFIQNVVLLFIFSVIMLIISYIFMRRKKYDSI